ncbi:hypothetical protein BHE74_00034439, partial [Ensete ventricosum]
SSRVVDSGSVQRNKNRSPSAQVCINVAALAAQLGELLGSLSTAPKDGAGPGKYLMLHLQKNQQRCYDCYEKKEKEKAGLLAGVSVNSD